MNKLIAITIGDINGIGIDILIKTWREKKIRNFILITNIKILNKILKKRKIKLILNIVNEKKIHLYTLKINLIFLLTKQIP